MARMTMTVDAAQVGNPCLPALMPAMLSMKSADGKGPWGESSGRS